MKRDTLARMSECEAPLRNLWSLFLLFGVLILIAYNAEALTAVACPVVDAAAGFQAAAACREILAAISIR